MINLKKFAIIGILAAAIVAPIGAQAQTVTHWVDRQLTKGKHQQTQKNNWRNAGYAGAGVAALGLLTHHPLLTAVGVAGGLYSANRYEQDRKGQNATARRRAAFFSQKTRTIDGHPYRRITVKRNGHSYYAYKRA